MHESMCWWLADSWKKYVMKMSEADGLKGMWALMWNYSYSLPGIMEYAYMMRIVEVADEGFAWSIDGFRSIFSLWQLEGKGSCDMDLDQSAGSMVM